jgi:single-stranded-DNA-specific exonuclease
MRSVWLPRSGSHSETIDGFSGEGRFPFLVQRILSARGISSSESLDQFLNPKLSNLKDPFLMQDMDKAVQVLCAALETQQKICIYGDFDLDGTSGVALLLQGLSEMGFQNLMWYQPKRLTEGYGFHAKVVESLFREHQVKTILTVDVGITSHEAAQAAKNLGMNVVITDHHQPLETLPPADAVVNPNRKDDISGLGYLCGAGVGFYLLRALARKLLESGKIFDGQVKLKNLLDCFTIATVTDMVPLIEDNRTLVKQGLVELARTQRLGLQALLNELKFTGRPISSQDLAIRIAPKINALSRMELDVRPIDLYLVNNESQASELMTKVMEQNSTRVQLQGSGEQEAFDLMKQQEHLDFVFVCSKNFHRGVVGLIATKLSQESRKPSFVGSISEDGIVTGSARRPQDFALSLLEIFNSAKEDFDRFGGHDAAAGFELHISKLESVKEKFQSFLEKKKLEPLEIRHFFDAEAKASELSEGLMKWMDMIGPFGQGFEVPVLKIENCRILEKRILKETHLKLKLDSETAVGRGLEALYFSIPPEHWGRELNPGDRIDVLGEVQWNYFAGQKSIQVLIKDLKRRSASNE